MKYFPSLILCVFFLCFPSAAYPSSTGSKVASSSQDLGRGSQKGNNAKLYSINNHTGAFSYFLGLTIPKGRGGLTPTTAGLSYSSQRNISWPARGWSVPMVCIHRKTNFGVPTYDNAKDRFFFVGFGSSANLVLINNESNVLEFQAKIEGHFRRYTFHTQEDRWVIRDKNGLVHNLGGIDASNSTYFARQIVAPGKTLSWCLAKTTDTNGNYIEYSYLDSTSTDTGGSFGKLYPDEILYTGNDNSATPLSPVHKIKFIYEENSGNKKNSLRSGYEVARNKKKLKNITYYLKTLGGFVPRRRLHITYSILGGNTNGDVVISQVQEEGIGSSGTSQYTHPIKFSYYKNEGLSNPNKTFLDAESISVPASIFQHYLTYAYEDSGSGYTYYLRDFVDLNGDGLKDYVVADAYNPVQTGAGWNGGHTYDSDNDTENKKDTTEWGVYFQKPDGSFTNLYKWRFAKDDCSSKCALRLVSKLVSTNSNTLANLVDLDGDSKPDYVQTNKWCKNNGKGFDQCVPLMELATPYSVTVKNIEINSHIHTPITSVVTHSLMDMNGDGFVDYVHRDINQGQMGLKVEYSCFNPFTLCPPMFQPFTSHLFSAFWNNPQGPSIQAGTQHSGIYLGSSNQYTSGGSLSTREFVDVNGDGLPDLLRGITTTSPGTVVLNYGNGSGFGPDIIDPNIGITNLGFEQTQIDDSTTQNVRFHQLIDADGDGLVDSVGADYGPNGTVSIVVKHNKGKGTFSSPQNWNGGPFIPALRKHYSQKTAGLFGNNYYDKYTTSMFTRCSSFG